MPEFLSSWWCRAGLVVVLLLGSPIVSVAQFAEVRGRVTDAADGQPLPGASVLLTTPDGGSQQGTAAGDDGYFILTRLPPGDYVLRVTFVGYQDHRDSLALGFDERHRFNIALEENKAAMNEVVIEGERQGEDLWAAAGFEAIRPSALARVPTPGVSADLASYLQTLPGVVAQGDRGGQLFVRGGTPTQNLLMLDGMPIFQPFHVVGFYSAFPADLVAFADAYTGGYSARYGGRLSSVIDVHTRNGNKQRLAGAASVAPFLSAARLEIPFVPGRLSILASVRESVIERISPDVLGQELPYRFGDRFLKVHAFLNRTSSLQLTGLHTFDEGDVANVDGQSNRIRWNNLAYGGHYTYLPEEFSALAQIRFFVSRLDSEYEPASAPHRTAEARTGGVEAKFVYYLGATDVHVGVFGRSYGFINDFGGADGTREEYISEGGMYLDVTSQLSPAWRVAPGLRMHSFPSRSQVSFEPRLRVTWRPGGRAGRHAFSAAWGLYRQDIVGLYNARDVTDAFTAWFPSPDGARVPRAIHWLAGWRGSLPHSLTLSAEAYYKDLDDLAFTEYAVGPFDGLQVDFVTGRAAGLDLKLEWLRPTVYASVAYSLAGVRYQRTGERLILSRQPDAPTQRTRTDDRRFAPPHDRRHQVNALLRYARGPYALSVRWQFGSGLPFTRSKGFYDAVDVETPDDLTTQPGRPVLIQSDDLYSARLPAYHRLDVSVERRFEADWFAATLQAGAINVYDRNNLFDYDLFSDQRIDQLPFIPSLGLRVEVP
ncbi:MAG: TonB-dependent receptor plug domain-containing protein [Bacteroidetes bacterium]|jgi:hypothetical protein|nr:TonB-dependent receptor plug domain-containing protein [Bacteroidota bacterium]